MDSLLTITRGVRIVDTFLGWSASEWAAICTFLLLVATVFYAVFTYKLLANQRESFVIGNNPIIGLDNIELSNMLSVKDEFVVAFHYKNFGKTATKAEFYTRAAILVGYVRRRGMSVKPIEPFPPMVLFPDQIGHNVIHVPLWKGLNSYNTYRLIRIGKLPLFFRAEIYYSGIDEKEYVSYALCKYNWKENGFGVIESYTGRTDKCDCYITGESRRRYDARLWRKDKVPWTTGIQTPNPDFGTPDQQTEEEQSQENREGQQPEVNDQSRVTPKM